MAHPNAGRKQSPEHVVRRMAAIKEAREADPTWRVRLSESMKGNSNGSGNKGRIQSEEQKQAHSDRMTGRSATSETRARMSESQRRVWSERTPEEVAALLERKQKVSYKPTDIERRVQQELDDEGVAFVIHPWVRVQHGGVKKVLRPDLLLPSKNLIVEVQGCYWHGCSACYGEKARVDRIVEDQTRCLLFAEQGYRVLLLWEHDIKSGLSVTIIDQA